MASSAVGFAVAGGRSRRMGRDKALLPWGPSTLLDHALARLQAATGEAPGILCGPEPRYEDHGVTVFPDIVTGAGPLGGLLTGLSQLDQPRGLFLAIDLPLVPVTVLTRLLDLAEGFDAAVPLSTAGPEPLCAVYGRGCLQAVRRHVEAADLKMTAFWPDVRVRQVLPGELADLGDPAQIFRNVNVRKDYEAVREAVERSQ
jgi:molybdopterin-guanine dinucleotide biosynthesis protein A